MSIYLELGFWGENEDFKLYFKFLEYFKTYHLNYVRMPH